MSEQDSFQDLVARVRMGDADAAEALVRKYEPALRRVIRLRMSDTRLGAAFDSMDVCQSVLSSFFLRAASGQYDLEEPAQLIGLLTAMARKKLAMKVRHERAAKRDNRKRAQGDVAEIDLAGGAATPSRILSVKEMFDAARQEFSPDELQLVEMRADGHSWSEIAETVGGTPESLRKKLARAVDRVATQLGVDAI